MTPGSHPSRREVLASGGLGIATLALPSAARAASDLDGVGGATGLLAWGGAAGDTRLGDAGDSLALVLEPTSASSASSWSAVAVGARQSLGVRDGRLYTWGSNVDGGTVQGTTSGSTVTPTEVVVAGISTWTAVAAGGEDNAVSLAIGDGKLYACGDDTYGMTGLGASSTTWQRVGSASDWTAISVGGYHCLGVRGGELMAWGYGFDGSLGLGATSSATTPTRVGAAAEWSICAAGRIYPYASLAVRDGELHSWGSNLNGVTGQGGTTGSSSTPQALGSTGWTALSLAAAAAGVRAGELWTWGRHQGGVTAQGLTGAGEEPDEAASPVRIGSESDWTHVAVGSAALLAVRAGQLWASGITNDGGTVGATGLSDGTLNVATLQRVGTAADWSAVAVSTGDTGNVGLGLRG